MNKITFASRNGHIVLQYNGKTFETEFPYRSDVNSEKFIFSIIAGIIKEDPFAIFAVEEFASWDNALEMARWITKNVPKSVWITQYKKIFNIKEVQK